MIERSELLKAVKKEYADAIGVYTNQPVHLTDTALAIECMCNVMTNYLNITLREIRGYTTRDGGL